MNNMTGYKMGAGIAVGLMVGIAVTLLLLKLSSKNGAVRTEYDERQKIIRGEAYKYGFWAALLGNAAIMAATAFGDLTGLGLSLYFMPILIGVVVQVSYCIFKDGYVGLNTNMPRFIAVMAAVAAFNFFLGIRANMDGSLVVNGVFQGELINILCGALFVILMAELLIKRCIDKVSE